MASYSLGSYVAYLFGIGKDTRQVWQHIKKHSRFKYTANPTITSTISLYDLKKAYARSFRNASVGDIVGKRLLGVRDPSIGYMQISYSFKFVFPSGSMSGKIGRNEVHEVIDVPFGMTKKMILELIKGKIRDWMEEHYEEQSEGRRTPAPQITFIAGI